MIEALVIAGIVLLAEILLMMRNHHVPTTLVLPLPILPYTQEHGLVV
jgi:hypothetical protein